MRVRFLTDLVAITLGLILALWLCAGGCAQPECHLNGKGLYVDCLR